MTQHDLEDYEKAEREKIKALRLYGYDERAALVEEHLWRVIRASDLASIQRAYGHIMVGV